MLYISSNTRPDISAAVSILAQRTVEPAQSDWNHVKKLICYLKGTSNFRLKLGGPEVQEELIGYSDANWAEDRVTRTSNTGYVFLLNGAVSWSCRQQDCVSLSSMEAEYVALSETCKEAVWLRRLLDDFRWKGKKKVTIYEDNQSVIKFIIDERLSNRTKHIDTRKYFVKDYVDENLIKVIYCPTEKMIADMLTKGLPKTKIELFRGKCNLISWD